MDNFIDDDDMLMDEEGVEDSDMPEFPYASWGSVCRRIFKNAIHPKTEKFPNYGAVYNTARLVACDIVLDDVRPVNVMINIPKLAVKKEDSEELEALGSWSVNFMVHGGDAEGSEIFEDILENEVMAPSSSFDDLWAGKWEHVTKSDEDFDISAHSDEELGKYVWGATVHYLRSLEDEEDSVKTVFNQAAAQWVVQTIRSEKKNQMIMLPGCSDLSIHRTDGFNVNMAQSSSGLIN